VTDPRAKAQRASIPCSRSADAVPSRRNDLPRVREARAHPFCAISTTTAVVQWSLCEVVFAMHPLTSLWMPIASPGRSPWLVLQ